MRLGTFGRLLRALLILFAMIAWLSFAAAGAQATGRPNVIVLVADDWGFSDVGAFGGEIPTPHLDALARSGVRFSNFHVSGSCSPTRAMLLTGVDHHLAGVGNLRESMPHQHAGQPGYEGSLNRRVVTLAERLKAGGYRTYVTGKWNVGNEPHNRPDARGFGRSLVQGDTGSDNWNPMQRYLGLSDRVYWFEDGREARMPERYYSSAFFVDRMIDYLKADGASPAPFLAYIGFQANHIPLQAPREFIEAQRGRYDAGWAAIRQARRDRAVSLGLIPADAPIAPGPAQQAWASLSDRERRHEARRMEVYAAMAQAMDHHVGRLMEHVRASGQWDNTVWIFLSDNGAEPSDPMDTLLSRWWIRYHYKTDTESMGEPGSYGVIGPRWASAAASPLSGHKFYAAEGGVRVPLIVTGAPGAAAGTIHHGFTHVTDLVPTVLALTGLTADQGPPAPDGRPALPLTGVSLMPALVGATQRVRSPDAFIGHELSGGAALYQGDLKLVRDLPPVSDGRWRLHDIVTDPGETRDLSDTRRAEFQAMQALYAQWERSHGVLPMPPDYRYDRQVLRNAIVNVYVPRYTPAVVGAVLGLTLWAALRWLVRRRRARRPS